MTYRDAVAEDWAAIDRVFRASFRATFAHLYAPADLETFLAGFTEEAWRAELGDPAFAFRIAEAAGSAVAYAKLAPLALPVEAQGRAAELRQLYVLEGWHGAGVASALMDWALAEARARADELYLTVFVDNVRARRFYDRYGFEAVGRYDFMVGNHADEDLIMRLKL